MTGSGSPEDELAALLDAADRDGVPLPQEAAWAGTQERAYVVQERGVGLRSARLGSPPVGWKVALTSAAAQAAVGAVEPASGVLLAADVRPDGAAISRRDVLAPLLEVELVFRLRSDLPPDADLAEVCARADVAAGLECPDGRHADWFGGDYPALALPAVVADNCLAGLLVLGRTWLPADEVDLPAVTAVLSVAGAVVAVGDAGNVLDSPAAAVVWLNAQQARRGHPLQAGALVSSGTLTPPLPFHPGRVRAELSAGLGGVAATLA